jgi:hypothetical protein
LFKIFLLLFFVVELFAVIPIKPREVGENPGISGDVSGAFETKRGNTDSDNYSAAFKLQYDNNTTYLIWGMLSGAYGEVNGVRNTNNLFAHLRYIRNLDMAGVAAEAFGQMEEDEFKSIKDRILGGGGLRWKVLNKGKDEWGGLFLGLGAYLEYIDYSTDIDPPERNVRINSYMAYTLPFRNDGVFSAVGYYQPKLTDFSDYYVVMSARIEFQIYRQLYLGFQVGYTHDSEPAIGVKKDDIDQHTLLKYKF